MVKRSVPYLEECRLHITLTRPIRTVFRTSSQHAQLHLALNSSSISDFRISNSQEHGGLVQQQGVVFFFTMERGRGWIWKGGLEISALFRKKSQRYYSSKGSPALNLNHLRTKNNFDLLAKKSNPTVKK